MKDFKTLGSIIFDGNKKRALGMQVEAAMVLEYFKELVGGIFPIELVRQLKPVSVSDKILRVKSSNSQLLAELRFQEKNLIESINDKFGTDYINKIQFILG